MLDPLLEKIGTSLHDAESRKLIAQRIGRITRIILLVVTICYALLLLALPALAAWVGEKNITIAFLLYLPRVIPLLPLPFLLLPTLFFDWRLALAQLAAGLVYLTFGMGYEWRTSDQAKFEQSPEPSQLIALTNNHGQSGNQSLQPFKNLTHPDIIALQETPGRANLYLADANYSEFKYGKSIGEHTFLSRHPILSGNLVHLGEDIEDNTPAVRFVIDFNGQDVVVYSVHFITVRDTLKSYRRGTFLYGILGIVPGTPFHRKMKENERFWLERIRTAEALKKVIDRETLPTLVLGDFNAPAGGYIQRHLTSGFQDTHQVTGSGFGYSFPGTTHDPLSLGGPWMRIDYILASKHWKVLASLTEEDRPSQHRAVATILSLK